ncbi:MAG: DUF4181 domain-containing protein [Prevotella sp.]|nr:DUF4181 domain-containing protein [Prevotella sp.]
MKKYLREIEVAGMILLAIGVAIGLTIGYNYGAWPCGFGMILLLIPFLYKAFHWKEYERENKQYILIILICIILLIIQLIRLK